MEELESKARKEVERIGRLRPSLSILDDGASGLVDVLDSYHSDSKGFLDRGQFLEALEAAFICWAYIDAGLHLGAFDLPAEAKKEFTVGD